VYLLLENESI